ncbi:uncharacterized protein LOC109601114 isoform X3 [Aethina tumida]|uniref:uncharacterized protein LOC109601114 isoform X1 n=1 Tax=Aethina tumida TaxID=116153 RepID=UPI002148CFD7|nr:uncharacterized protein LOC109601114 isoform X1 [Aethina tumida]XP_049820512.1 uncharacterized protein LOC109601114 isoform X3 [Aethina tumida]
MFIKSLIILGLVAQCFCYDWSTDGKRFNTMCANVKKAFLADKLTKSQIKSRTNTCLGAHLNDYTSEDDIVRYTTEDYNTDNAYKDIFQRNVFLQAEGFHNFIYCMEGLLR